MPRMASSRKRLQVETWRMSGVKWREGKMFQAAESSLLVVSGQVSYRRSQRSSWQDSSLGYKGNSGESGSGCNAFSITWVALQSFWTSHSMPQPNCTYTSFFQFSILWDLFLTSKLKSNNLIWNRWLSINHWEPAPSPHPCDNPKWFRATQALKPPKPFPEAS